MPLGIPDYHKTLATLHDGCEKPHAYFIPYPDRAAAEVSPSRNRENVVPEEGTARVREVAVTAARL